MTYKYALTAMAIFLGLSVAYIGRDILRESAHQEAKRWNAAEEEPKVKTAIGYVYKNDTALVFNKTTGLARFLRQLRELESQVKQLTFSERIDESTQHKSLQARFMSKLPLPSPLRRLYITSGQTALMRRFDLTDSELELIAIQNAPVYSQATDNGLDFWVAECLGVGIEVRLEYQNDFSRLRFVPIDSASSRLEVYKGLPSGSVSNEIAEKIVELRWRTDSQETVFPYDFAAFSKLQRLTIEQALMLKYFGEPPYFELEYVQIYAAPALGYDGYRELLQMPKLKTLEIHEREHLLRELRRWMQWPAAKKLLRDYLAQSAKNPASDSLNQELMQMLLFFAKQKASPDMNTLGLLQEACNGFNKIVLLTTVQRADLEEIAR